MAANFNIVPVALLEIPGSVRGDQGAASDGAAAARGEHRHHVPLRLPPMTTTTTMTLTPDLASRFASLVLSHVTREYPNKLDHVLNGPDDLRVAAPPASGVLRQLRLALERARLLAARDALPSLSRAHRRPRADPRRCSTTQLTERNVDRRADLPRSSRRAARSSVRTAGRGS